MSIRSKTAVLFGLTTISLVVLLYLIARATLLTRFARMEDQYTRETVNQVKDYLDDELRWLDTLTKEHAAWDAMFQFAADLRADFAAKQFTPHWFQDLRIDFFAVLSPTGELRYARTYEPRRGAVIPMPAAMSDGIAQVMAPTPGETPTRRGWVLLPHCPAMVAARWIEPTKADDAPRGTLVMGRCLTRGLVEKLGAVFQAQVTYELPDDPAITPDFRRARDALLAHHAAYLDTPARDASAGYFLVRDARSRPALIFRVEQPRSIFRQGQQTVLYLFFGLAAVAMAFGLMGLAAVDRIILSRVTRLSREVIGIANSGDPGGRVQMAGFDELSALAFAINGMLKAMEQNARDLRASESKFRSLIENSFEGILLLSREANILYASPSVERLTGHTPAELAGRPVIDLFRSSDQEADDTWLRDLAALSDGARTTEALLRRKDGSRRWMESTATNLLDDPNVQAIVFNFRDVHERRSAEETLRLTQFSVELASDAVFWIDAQARFLYVNQAACRALGYSRAELLSMTVHDIDPVFPVNRWAEHWEDLQRTGSLRFESVHRTKDGRAFPVEINANYLRFGGQEFDFAFSRDLTERKRAEQEKDLLEAELHHAQKMEAIGRLAGGVAHDFNNLLTGIRGYADMVSEALDPHHELQADLDEIKKATTSATSLTNQLLAFSRKQISSPRVIDLNDLVASSRRLLGRLIGEHIQFIFRPQRDLRPVKVDPHQIEQVLVNLSVNARDAMPAGGRLTIETANVDTRSLVSSGPHRYAAEELVMIAVRDTGVGMTDEVQAHLFEPFFTTKEKGKGTGLGLATVYGIVQQNQGFIHVESKPDAGTAFRLYFPVAKGQPEAVAESVAPTMPTGEETILLAEDEEVVRNLAEKILTKLGYRVLIASDGHEAVVLGEQHRQSIKLLLTDIIMPHLNGKDLYTRLREVIPGLKVIYMSGYTEDVFAHDGVLDDNAVFIQKPFTLEHITQKIRDVLDRA
jgi:PAS domain S-box-containing protein